MSIFGTYLPFLGWRAVDNSVVCELIEDDDYYPTHSYSAFMFAWLWWVFIFWFNDNGEVDE